MPRHTTRFLLSVIMSHTLHGPMTLSDVRTWHVDIDRFINPWVPAPRLYLLPRQISHFLGYRETAPRPLGNVVIAFWSLVGSFCGVALVAEVSARIPSFEVRDAPAVVGSFVSSALVMTLFMFHLANGGRMTRVLLPSLSSARSSRPLHNRVMPFSVRCGLV